MIQLEETDDESSVVSSGNGDCDWQLASWKHVDLEALDSPESI